VTKTLNQLLAKIDPALCRAGEDFQLSGDANVSISGLSLDSRQIERGMMFVALAGAKLDGRLFIPEACQRGAAAILTDTEAAVPAGVTVMRARDPRRLLAPLAAAFYERQPTHIAAVTGTNGKTSTAQFLREITQSLGHKSASVGTLGVITAAGEAYGSLTTPDAITLHKVLAELAETPITHVCLEASSHGLSQRRLAAVRIKAAGFTNLTRDHLDFHGTMENYFAAKALLFSEVMAPDGVAVLNADTPQAETLSAIVKQRGGRVIAYGQAASADLRLLELKAHAQGQSLSLELFGSKIVAEMGVVGRFQAWNALCALGLAVGLGAEPMAAAASLPKLTGVRGRLQHVATHPSGAAIFVDYAHTPDALETVLKALRPHVEAKGRLCVVFGCGGNRDPGKRPIMGEIAQRLADLAIVTDDNPRKEDPATIRAAILQGCKPEPKVTEIADRHAAIDAAVKQLRTGDILVVAGKGHEPGQIIGDQILPFDDGDVVRQSVAAL
jgi:UDP-N-acetylmuramoyl-L-alanyl-D-glutamate--2,6-diaminopimelate ligase